MYESVWTIFSCSNPRPPLCRETQTAAPLKIGALNKCSLRYKRAEVAALIRDRSHDVLRISETWLGPEIADGELSIHGYNLHHNDRHGRMGGGVCFYYHQDLPIRARPDLHSDKIESAWLEIKGPLGCHLIGCIYRPPPRGISILLDRPRSGDPACQAAIGLHYNGW